MAKHYKTDWTLFFTVLAMVTFGLVFVFSASSAMAKLRWDKDETHFIIRQVLFTVPGVLLMMFCKRLDYHVFRRSKVVFSILACVMTLLVAAFFMDPSSHRWIRISAFGLQPSELAKPALCLFLAYFLSQHENGINTRQTLIPIGLVIVVLTVAVGIGDFGTAMLLVLTTAAVVYVAGLNWRYIAAALALILVFGVVEVAMKPYRLSRVLGFVDPDGTILEIVDPAGKVKQYASKTLSTRDTSYQARQSRISIGSGGVLGQGLMQSKQKLLFLPEAHTDFIYAVIGEELGLLGCLAVVVGFLLIMWRGFLLFLRARDPFGKYLALSITSAILIQALINISVVLDMGPTKGFPLPLISYGGSSMLATLFSLGLLLSVSEQAE